MAKQMLGERFSGTLVSDRWCAYNWVDVLKRQVGWSHLIREFEGFLVKGVDPTNNMAERDLRHAVIWRKRSYGTSSPAGSRFVERILTAAMTLRKQERNVLEFLTTACEALLVGAPGPSLLPVQAAHLTSAAA